MERGVPAADPEQVAAQIIANQYAPPCPDPDRLQHVLGTQLTVLHLRTELLARQLDRRDGLSTEARAWLAAGLAQVVAASRAKAAAVDGLPSPRWPQLPLEQRRPTMEEPGMTGRCLDEAIAHLEQVLAALAEIAHTGERGRAVDGIEYELRPLEARLRALRDEVIAAGDAA